MMNLKKTVYLDDQQKEYKIGTLLASMKKKASSNEMDRINKHLSGFLRNINDYARLLMCLRKNRKMNTEISMFLSFVNRKCKNITTKRAALERA